jgi:coronin-1B/1C/6
MAKTSKLRHTRAQIAKPDSHYINISPTNAIWDSGNFMACSEKFIAVPWHASGSTAVLRHDQFGKLPSALPVLLGHGGPVIDLAFSPFDGSLLFTGSEDATIRGWRIPDGGLTSNDVASIVELKGHSKKVGILAFHPSASNVLASAGMDGNINLWDVETGAVHNTLKSSDQFYSMNWNLDGSLLNTTTRDKKVSIIDSRTGTVAASADAHQGPKCQRSIWAKRKNLIVTLGFDKNQRRELMVWDCRNFTKPIHAEEMDQASSVTMPFYDEDTSMLYIGSKGDGSIRYYELCSEAPQLLSCSQYTSADPAKGLCMMPKKTLDVKKCEVARFYFLGAKSIYPLRMILPRKQSEVEFQEDVFPPTFASEPAISAKEFFEDKKNSEPRTTDLRGLFDGTGCVSSDAPAAVFSPVRSEPQVDSSAIDALRGEVAAAKKRVDDLKGSLAAAEADFANKEAQLSALEKVNTATPTDAKPAEPPVAPAASEVPEVTAASESPAATAETETSE